jgi:hypothetical protein
MRQARAGPVDLHQFQRHRCVLPTLVRILPPQENAMAENAWKETIDAAAREAHAELERH